MIRGAAAGADRQLVTLSLGRESFAVPVDSVLEILAMRDLYRVPEAPGYLAGLLDVRGRAVPVIDLRRKLGMAPADATHDTRIIVLEVTAGARQLVLGLIADRVFEVLTLEASQIGPAPEIGVRWSCDYIAGVARRDDGFIIILDMTRLFSGGEADALLMDFDGLETGPDELADRAA